MSVIPVQEFFDPKWPEDDVAQYQLAVDKLDEAVRLDRQPLRKKFVRWVTEGHQWTVERASAMDGVALAQERSETFRDYHIYFLQYLASREAQDAGVKVDQPEMGLIPSAVDVVLLPEK